MAPAVQHDGDNVAACVESRRGKDHRQLFPQPAFVLHVRRGEELGAAFLDLRVERIAG